MTTDDRLLSRRQFLAAPGLVIVIPLEEFAAAQEPARLPQRAAYPEDFNAYLRIAPDNRVTCYVGKVELGQGSMTALAQLVAEELDVALDAVTMVMGDTDVCPWDMGTFGSLSIRQFGPVLRAAGARARAVLLELAAERLQVPAEKLQVTDGIVRDPSSGRRVSYGELVQGKRIERRLEKAPLKSPATFRVIGRSPRRKDALEKVTGQARYAGDVRLPGMLQARILRPPAHGAVLKSVDTSAAEKIPGVRVVRDGDLIAVLHEHREVADRAPGTIRAEWERPPATLDEENIFEHLLKNRSAATRGARGRKPARRSEAFVHDRRGALPERLRGTRSPGDPFGHSARGRGQGDGVGRYANAVPAQAADRAGAGRARGKRARHHDLRGRRLRRQERFPPGNRGCAAGQAHGPPVQVVWGQIRGIFL
jgi:CO/xanthine dehydrogenase Mo-binding subunit